MKFKSLDLTINAKHVHIRQKHFLSALVANLNMRLTTVSCNLNSTEYYRDADRKEYKTLLDNFSVLVKEYWPREVSASYGTNEIRFLCDRFGLDFSTYLGLSGYIWTEMVSPFQQI